MCTWLVIPAHVNNATLEKKLTCPQPTRVTCTRVKELGVGRMTTENQMWSSESLARAFVKNALWKSMSPWLTAAAMLRFTSPSSSSVASHRPHRKKYLPGKYGQCNYQYILYFLQHMNAMFMW